MSTKIWHKIMEFPVGGEKYRDGWERTFGKKKKPAVEEEDKEEQEENHE